MDIPFICFTSNGGDLALYRDVYQYSNMFLSDDEIAKLTQTPVITVRIYKSRLKKTTTDLPADEMTQEALYGYLSMSETMLQDMMQVYLEMREDRDIFRNNSNPQDGKRRMPVHPKDLIALMQTLMKTQLERAVVLTKFAAISERRNGLPQNNTPISPQSLMSQNSIDTDIIDVEMKQLD